MFTSQAISPKTRRRGLRDLMLHFLATYGSGVHLSVLAPLPANAELSAAKLPQRPSSAHSYRFVVNTPRPNVFLIGAMKSATTYLGELLKAHPSIFVSAPKEPCYFVNPEVLRRVWPYAWSRGLWRSQDNYLSIFAGAGEARIICEASTVYSRAPLYDGVPERILAFNPNARFVYIMRDPVERTISHYWHMVNNHNEHRGMLAAIRADPQYTDTSHYFRQLQTYLKVVNRERIYTMTYENLMSDRVARMADLYRWLGVDPAVRPDAQLPANATPDVIEKAKGFGLLKRFRESQFYSKLEPSIPKAVRRLGNKLAIQNIKPDEVPTTEVVRYLRSIQRPQTANLSRLLGRNFPEWTTLYGED